MLMGARPYHESEYSNESENGLKILAQNYIFSISTSRGLPIVLQEDLKPARVTAQPGPPKEGKSDKRYLRIPCESLCSVRGRSGMSPINGFFGLYIKRRLITGLTRPTVKMKAG